MQFAPLLFMLYQMLKDDEAITEESNSEEENADEQTHVDKNKSSIAEALLTYTPDVSAASVSTAAVSAGAASA